MRAEATFQIGTPALCMLALVLCGVFVCSGCSLFGDEASTFGDAERVTATLAEDELVVTNHTREPIWTFVIGRASAALIYWVPHLEGEGLAPGASERIKLSDIDKSKSEDEVLVYWWQAIVEDGERVPGEVHSLRVEL